MLDYSGFVEKMKELHFAMRDVYMKTLLKARRTSFVSVSRIAKFGVGDLSYAIDKVPDKLLEKTFEKWGKEMPMVVVEEEWGATTFPKGTRPEDCEIKLIIDRLDGTREIMYGKNRAWILTGIAPNKGAKTYLDDIEVAVQTSVGKSVFGEDEVLWATKKSKPVLETWNLDEGEFLEELPIRPSQANTIEHGFFPIVLYFEGYKKILGDIADELTEKIIGSVHKGISRVFDEQYITSGGELAYLVTGKYRGIIDIRPFLGRITGTPFGLCAHPYDLCTKLIVDRAKAIIHCYGVYTDRIQKNVPLDATTDVAFIAFANERIRRQVEPTLKKILANYNIKIPI
jgi:hypothetical protein